MRSRRFFFYVFMTVFLGGTLIGCHPKMDMMAKAEKVFVKMVDGTAAKLHLNQGQKIELERLKLDIQKNFQEGRMEKREAMIKIKEEGLKENPDIQKMTSLLQGSLEDETERINRAFDFMVDFQKNLNEGQKKKLNQMISEWVAKWD